MSENYGLHVEKMEQLRAANLGSRPVHKHLVELLQFVRECEAVWKPEDQVACSGEDK